MNFAVCDDQLDYLNLVVKKVQESFHDNEIPLNIYPYSNVSEFLRSVSAHSYQFAIIEMDVEGGRGIQLAQLLMKLNPACRIVFMSHQYKNIHEAFSVNAMEYILKPINSKDFEEILDYLMKWYKDQNIKFVIPIRELRNKKIFYVNEIKYIETYYNDMEIVTVDDKHYIVHVKNRYKLRAALRSRWFLQVNQSVLINMNCIDFLTDRNVILKSREVFSVSRKYLMKIHLTFDRYLSHISKKF